MIARATANFWASLQRLMRRRIVGYGGIVVHETPDQVSIVLQNTTDAVGSGGSGAATAIVQALVNGTPLTATGVFANPDDTPSTRTVTIKFRITDPYQAGQWVFYFPRVIVGSLIPIIQIGPDWWFAGVLQGACPPGT